MDVKAWFEQTIVPCVRADGGWLEMEDADGEEIRLTARGECAHCAALDRCLNWAQMKAKQELGLEKRFSAKRDPFLWRK